MRSRIPFLLLSLATAICPLSSQAAGWLWNMPPNTVWLDSGKRNNVFYVGDTVSFRPTASGAATYDVRDYWGNVIDQGTVGSTLSPKVTQPGWYKINLHGTTSQSPWGDSVGSAIFTIMRKNANFPTLPAQNVSGGADPLLDLVMRGVAGIGPERHSVQDVNNPSAAIAKLDAEIALDKQWYANTDTARPRPLMIAFPNGTSQNLNGVKQIVAHFKNDVKYWEPRNEPNDIPGNQFAVNEMKPFYDAVKSVDPTAKVLGPGVVSLSLLPWIEQFLQGGGGNCIDAFSFHAYGNVNGDVWLARKCLDDLNTLLAKYGVQNLEKWQTEQGYFAASYGVYQPRLNGRWTMVQMMAFEQYGIPKEHNNYWYDRCGGFWDFPAWWSNEDGSLNPGAAMMRVWSEELYGKQFVKALDFGTPGNQLYIGSQFSGSGKQVYALMSTGMTDGSVEINVPGVSSVHVVSAFGVEQDVTVTDGKATIAVPELPVYIETTGTLSVTPFNYGTNLARQNGVTVAANSVVGAPPVTTANDPARLVNGFLESSYYGTNDVWRHDTSAFPAWIDIQFPTATTMDRVVIYAAPPWSLRGSLLDYDLQYLNSNGQWVTIQTVTEPTKTFQAYSPINRTNEDSYYSDRWIFNHSFSPITTQKLRLYVRDVTWGGDATLEALNTGGQGGPHQITLREIEVYSTGTTTSTTPTTPTTPVVTGTGNGLLGDYYSGQNFATKVVSRTDATVNFDWGSASPASGVPADHFSVRWTGQVQPQYSETYTFYTNSDDGIRLWVNGQQVINNWTDHAATENNGSITLTAGQKYDIKLEFYENAENAVAKLLWSSPSQTKQVIPAAQLYSSAPTTVVNTAPTATNDSAVTSESTPVTINVLANDTDPDNGPGALSLVSAGAASNGMTSSTNGQVTYTPNAGFVGTDQFTYTISDGAATASGTVTVTVNSTALASSLTGFGLTGGNIGSDSGASRVLSNNAWEVTSIGGGISAATDSFHFESKSITGDFQIVAKINSLTSTSNAARAGIMIREDVSPGARYVALATTTGTNYKYASRSASGVNATESAATETYTYPNAWIMLQRVGDTITVTESSDDQTYRQATSVTLTGLPTTVTAGLFCCSGSQGINARMVATDYQVIPLAGSAGSGSGSGTGLLGQYYNTSSGSAQSVLSRVDPTVNFDWGTGSPGSQVPVDRFSVRWVGQVQAQYSETYTFYTTSDDGIRLWVNGQQVINNWTDHAATENSGAITLVAGQKYDITLEYYEASGGAVAKLMWSSPSQPKQVIPQSQLYPPTPAASGSGSGLQGDYFTGMDLGSLVLSRTDTSVNFNWGTGSPASGVPVDRFSVRWTGQVQPRYSETYTFYTNSDDGVRLWVNGQQVVNNWTDHGLTENSGTIALTAGQKYDIRLEYYENSGGAVSTLSWSSPSQAKEIIPQSQLYPPTTSSNPGSGSGTGGAGTGLKADYFNGQDLANLLLSRTDATVDFNWGNGSPDAAIPADHFSVRWTGQVQPLYSETYYFYTNSDDGIRLWVNGQQLINNWTDHGATENSGAITLNAGQKYDIKLEYYENAAGAVASLLWSSPSQPKQVIPQSQLYPATSNTAGTGLKGEYFNGTGLSSLVLSRTDGTVNFDWGAGSPAGSLPVDRFSARWTGMITPTVTGTYTFTTSSDDGVRLWIGGQQLVNNWSDHAQIDNSGTILLKAGQSYSLKMEYYESTGNAVSALYWTPPGGTRQIVPQSALTLP